MSATALTIQPPRFLKLLAHEVRWNILVLLARSDYCVQELARLIQQPQNLVSYHLKQLRSQNIVTERRSAADSRDIYYSLDFDMLHTLYFAAAETLHPALSRVDTTVEERASHLPDKPIQVLFLCTENSARSQMAEALMRHMSKGKVEAFSAGSNPSPIHPYAIRVMAAVGIDISRQRPKHFDKFSGQSFNYIITLCDRMLEVCPTFPDDPERIHWSFPNPAAVERSEEEKYRAFEQVGLQLTNRIRLLLTRIERQKGKTV
jgi:protein-tyrosine-phosphatase/DNA-binding transcriptional ArsR family regulator